MIQYDKDGATLFYIDAKGTKISAGVFDGARYNEMLDVEGAQRAAALWNKDTAASYSATVQSAQASVDAGRPAPPLPAKPLQRVVDDTGAVSYAPFVPPLPDLVIPVVSAPSSGTIAVSTVDKQAIMYAMITAIYRKMFPAG